MHTPPQYLGKKPARSPPALPGLPTLEGPADAGLAGRIRPACPFKFPSPGPAPARASARARSWTLTQTLARRRVAVARALGGVERGLPDDVGGGPGRLVTQTHRGGSVQVGVTRSRRETSCLSQCSDRTRTDKADVSASPSGMWSLKNSDVEAVCWSRSRTRMGATRGE
eukprot:124891-Rhodomonas_salina.3